MKEGEIVTVQTTGLRFRGPFAESAHRHWLHTDNTGDHMDHFAPSKYAEGGDDQTYPHDLRQDQLKALQKAYPKGLNIDLVPYTQTEMNEIAKTHYGATGQHVKFVPNPDLHVSSRE